VTITTLPLLFSSVAPVKNGGPDTLGIFTKNSSGQTVSAGIELQSSDAALLHFRLTQAEIDNLIPSYGMQVFNEDTMTFNWCLDGVTFQSNPGIIIPSGNLLAPTYNNQLSQVSTGYNQGGFGGGSVGTNLTMSATTALAFDLQTAGLGYQFVGGLFDGRYVYLIPGQIDPLAKFTRYDTQSRLGFKNVGSYEVFEISLINLFANGFAGGVYDGRYIYLAPYINQLGVMGLFVRYDTQSGLGFTNPGSYEIFDMTAVSAKSVGFIGAVFDSRYIYLVPQSKVGFAFQGQITRYDTQSGLGFSNVNSYEVFDMQTINANCYAFAGGVYDGRYVYFVPGEFQTASNTGFIVQYDTTLPFTNVGSYVAFDVISNIDPSAGGYYGAVFDGTFIYFVPQFDIDSHTQNGLIMRYDTTQPFDNENSYLEYDIGINVSALCVGFNGAVFDNKYIYFIPNENNIGDNGLIARYDVTQIFTVPTSYSTFDTATINANNVRFNGGVYDGQYIYLVPDEQSNGYITRINAYTGGTVNAISAIQAPNGFVVGSFSGKINQAQGGNLVSDNISIGNPNPNFAFQLKLVESSFGNFTGSDVVKIQFAIQTTDASNQNLFIWDIPNTIPHTAVLMRVEILAFFTDGTNAAYTATPTVFGAYYNGINNTAIGTAPTITLNHTSGASALTAAWHLGFPIINIIVNGIAGKTINWIASVEIFSLTTSTS
jgi:hypothetical protein